MSMTERVFGVLLRIYPASFRRDYGEQMRQAFRDRSRDALGPSRQLRLWRSLLVDALRSAPALHLEEARAKGSIVGPVLASVFGLCAAVFLGRFELHTDDTGVEVFFILLFTFILGCWYPKRAATASLISLSVPFAELVWGRPQSPVSHSSGLWILAGVVALLGLAGSYSGVFVRRILIGK